MDWLLAITLASNPTHTEFYEFKSLEDCMNAVAPVEVLYESLRDKAEVRCLPKSVVPLLDSPAPEFERMNWKVKGVSFTL